MRENIREIIEKSIGKYCEANGIEHIWEEPIVGFADAKSQSFSKLKTVVKADHCVPGDFLEDASIVVSYFLPFKREIGKSNKQEGLASEVWADAYKHTNAMSSGINQDIIDYLKGLDYKAVEPGKAIGFAEEELKSRWSQRHVAYIAGIGTFGINNMLISEKGGCGRYFSVITNLDVTPDEIVKEERCKYKVDKTCGACVKRCKGEALTYEGFDRFKCYESCSENREKYGYSVCGKCVVELPCSHKNPVKK